LIVRQRHFLGIHTCLITVFAVYILSIGLQLNALKTSEKTDDNGTWIDLQIVSSALFDVLFYSTLLIASTGWCVVQVVLSVYVILSFVAAYVNVGSWAIALVIGQIVALLVLYNQLLWVICFALFVFAILSFFLTVLKASSWVGTLCHNTAMLCAFATLQWVYRPRGEALDRQLQADEEAEGQNPTEIALEDLDGFAVNEARGELRQWHEDWNCRSSHCSFRRASKCEAPQSGETTVD
jgi:hypothetical protein